MPNQNTPHLPTAADLDAVAAEQQVKDATAGLQNQPTVELPNPAPGEGPEGSATVAAVDAQANAVTLEAHPSPITKNEDGTFTMTIKPGADLLPVPHPQATPPAHPEVEAQSAVPGDAPDSLPNTTSHGEGVKGGPTQPSRDTEEFDDAGNEKADQGIDAEGFGPRGVNLPGDVQTEEERKVAADAQEKKLQAGMAPTNKIDSTGALKGSFAVTPQGHDKHGMRLPDKIDTTKVLEPVAAHVGPRGAGAPLDSFHGARPAKK